MRKVIASINMTLDGYCDHTYGVVDDALHKHYTGLIRNAGTLLYGRVTYQLMESFWPLLVKEPSGEPAMDEFAKAIDGVPKVVFSHTLDKVNWHSARLAVQSPEEEIKMLRQESGGDIFIGSPGLIAYLTRMKVIDEYQLCVHPVIAGQGLPLFKNLSQPVQLHLEKTKLLPGGQMILYYVPV